MQTKIYYILLIIFILHPFGWQNCNAQELDTIKKIKIPIVKERDSLLISAKELNIKNDTIKNDSISAKEYLEGIIIHKADSYINQDFINERITLYDNAEIDYLDNNLKAGIIIIDYKTNLITAKGIKDSVSYNQLPIFKQGSEETAQDSLVFNFRSEKAKIWGLRTEQQGVNILGEVTKKENDSTIYVRKIRFTTSAKDNPDYYIQTDKAKIVPNKKIVIGLSNLVIADVPTPLFLPFAYIPLTKGTTSGFLIPTWGQNNNQGYFLQNGGYYLAINDYVDLAVLGDVYTNGSWGVRTESSYALRYRFNGNFSFRYENLINSLRGFDDYSKSTNYNIRWSHSQDNKANPNVRFSASVNLGSSKYYKESINEYNTNSFLNNTLSSSISYYRKFVGTPFNMSLSATHSQNTNTESIAMTLPSLQINMDRLYPFASKTGAKNNAIKKIGLTYSLKGDNRIQTTDEFFFKKEMFDEARSGIQHNVSLNTNMKALKFFTLSPNATYKDVWYFDHVKKRYDALEDEVVTDTINGFKTFREYNAGVSLSTTLYGDFKFKKGRLNAIRHTVRPSISYSYRPDFSFYYDEVQQSADPTDVIEYSPFEQGIYGSPGKSLSNSLGISLNSTLEAKVMPKDSTETEAKKIKLLNNLNFSTNYNIAADSLKWSPVSMSAGTQLLNNKLNVNLNATLDPYAINANGRKIEKFNINNGGSLFRLTNAGLTMNYSLKSDKSKKDESSSQKNTRDNNSEGIFGDDLRVSNDPNSEDTSKKEVKTSKLYTLNIPWSLSLAYSLNYSNSQRQSEISSNSLMFSGDLELTPKWKVGFSSGYDFKNEGFTYTQLRFSRDLDSWKLNFNWVPFGNRQTYYFFIGVKSSVLSDLKYDKRQVPDRRLF